MTGTESTGDEGHKRLLEAALFMASEPLSMDRLSKIVGVHSLGYLKNVLDGIERDYAEKGFHLVELPEGYMFQVDNRFLPKVASLAPYADLPDGEKRTLALVAYKEPVTQSEVIKTQGNKAYAYIKHLVKKGLIKAERQGRTKMLSLTQEFERYFGENREAVKEKLVSKLREREPARPEAAPRPGPVQPGTAGEDGGKGEEGPQGSGPDNINIEGDEI